MKTLYRTLAALLAAFTIFVSTPRAEASVVALDIVETSMYISPDQTTRWRRFSAISPVSGQMVGQFELGTGPAPGQPTGVMRNWLYSFSSGLRLEPKSLPAPAMVSIFRPSLLYVTEWWNEAPQTSGTTAEQHYFAFTTAQQVFGWILADFGSPEMPTLTILSGGLSVGDNGEQPSPIPLPASLVLLASGLGGLALRRKPA